MKYSMSEILKAVSLAPTKEDKIALLRANETHQLKTVLQYALDPYVKWLLPEGPVPYKPQNPLGMEGRLYAETRRLYLFVEAAGVMGNPNLHPRKREMLFIQLLEGIHPADAELLVAVKDKKLPYEGITSTLINEAYPGLLHVEVKETPKVVRRTRGDDAKKAAGTRGTKKPQKTKKSPGPKRTRGVGRVRKGL